MTKPLENLTAAKLLRGLHLATALNTAVLLFGFALPLIVANASIYDGLGRQVVAFVLLAVVAFVGAPAVWRGWNLRWLRWVLLAAVAVASALALTGVPAQYLTSEAEWSYGLIGWFGLLLLLDHSAVAAVVFLAAHNLASLTQLIVLGQDVGDFTMVAVLLLGFQLPVVAATMALGRFAATAAAASREAARIRTAEAIAEQLHEDRKARYADLVTTTVPLLVNLANGASDLANSRVRTLYLVEAARMRRLFAESDDVPDPLLHELRACVDMAERRGVTVSFGTCGDGLPSPPKQIRRELTEPVLRALAAATTQARVTVLGSPTAITVSVVADAPGSPDAPAGSEAVTVTHLVEGNRMWVEATWQPKT